MVVFSEEEVTEGRHHFYIKLPERRLQERGFQFLLSGDK